MDVDNVVRKRKRKKATWINFTRLSISSETVDIPIHSSISTINSAFFCNFSFISRILEISLLFTILPSPFPKQINRLSVLRMERHFSDNTHTLTHCNIYGQSAITWGKLWLLSKLMATFFPVTVCESVCMLCSWPNKPFSSKQACEY